MLKFYKKTFIIIFIHILLFSYVVSVYAQIKVETQDFISFDYANYHGADKKEVEEKLKAANVKIDPDNIVIDSQEFIEAHKEKITDNNLLANASLPSSVLNDAYFPMPSSTGQGNQNSCSAWASAYYLKSGQETINKGWLRNTINHIFSPAYVFNVSTSGGQGITLGEAMYQMYSRGVCTLSYMPYNDSDYRTQPNSIQNADAALYRINDFWTTDSISDIKRNIYEYGGACISVLLYPEFYNLSSANEIYDTIDSTCTDPGYHSLCLIGYDDAKQAFKFINSWGNGTQLGGYGWISYALVNNPQVNLPGAGVSFVMEYQDNSVLMGDVNRNGSVTAQDAQLANKYANSLISLTAEQYVLADVDGDGDVDSTDAQNILNYCAHNIQKFPIYN